MDGTLARSGLLAGTTRAERRVLTRYADLVDLEPGQPLVRDGAWRAGCYLLLRGAVVTTTSDESWLTSGNDGFVGLAEALVGAPAQGETVALCSSTVLAFTAPGLAGAVDAVRPLRHAALAHLARAWVQGHDKSSPLALPA